MSKRLPIRCIEHSPDIEASIENQIISPNEFSHKIEDIFSANKMLDYSEFDFESLLSEKQSLEKYFSDVYSSEEVKGLLKIYTKNFLKPSNVLKIKDLPFTSVMIIVSGRIGVYHYPDGTKTLFKELKSKEIIGDFELNFISSRSA